MKCLHRFTCGAPGRICFPGHRDLRAASSPRRLRATPRRPLIGGASPGGPEITGPRGRVTSARFQNPNSGGPRARDQGYGYGKVIYKGRSRATLDTRVLRAWCGGEGARRHGEQYPRRFLIEPDTLVSRRRCAKTSRAVARGIARLCGVFDFQWWVWRCWIMRDKRRLNEYLPKRASVDFFGLECCDFVFIRLGIVCIGTCIPGRKLVCFLVRIG